MKILDTPYIIFLSFSTFWGFIIIFLFPFPPLFLFKNASLSKNLLESGLSLNDFPRESFSNAKIRLGSPIKSIHNLYNQSVHSLINGVYDSLYF